MHTLISPRFATSQGKVQFLGGRLRSENLYRDTECSGRACQESSRAARYRGTTLSMTLVLWVQWCNQDKSGRNASFENTHVSPCRWPKTSH